MKKLMQLLLGYVWIEAMGAYPERLINLCAQHGIPFWKLEWKSETCLRLRVFFRDYERFQRLSARAMCEVTVLRQTGVPVFLLGFRKRYALIAGLIFFFLVVSVFSRFILVVEVTGNEAVPTSEILRELDRLGVRPWVFGPSVETGEVKNKILLAIPELSWLTVNLNGNRAQVIVREREAKPKILDESVPSNVVAAKSGIITRMEVLEGKALTQTGHTVLEGDLLVSGVYDLEGAQWSGVSLGSRYVHAMANVYARTWYTITAKTPLLCDGKAYTGQERTRFALLFGKHRINIYANAGISFADYDKIKKTHSLTLPGGLYLPLALVEERYRAYDAVSVRVNRESAEEMMQRKLAAELMSQMDENGKILRVDFTAQERDGVLVVTLLGECEEQIGRVVEIQTDK